MAVVGTGLTLQGLKSEFFQRFDQASKAVHYQDLATRIQSRTKKETYAFMGTVPAMREWGTGRVVRGVYTESYDVENLKYEISMEVDRDELSDDQTGQIKLRTHELANRAATHKDSEIGRLLANGHNAGYNSYDGKRFFAADHESGGSGTQTNILTRSGTVDKDNPTTAEFRGALSAALAQLLALKDDQGEPMNLSAQGLVAVVPPNMMITASEAVNATIVASTTNVLQGAAQIVPFAHLTATDAWYLLKTDVAVRPIIFQDREPIEFGALEGTSDEGFLREKFIYGVRARYRMTYGYWQHAMRIVFTA